MAPALHDGDYLVARRYGRRVPAIGDLAVVRHRQYGLMVKRVIAERQSGGFDLAGDGTASTPAVDLRSIPLSCFEARVLCRLPIGR